jgi:hypothetical protein
MALRKSACVNRVSAWLSPRAALPGLLRALAATASFEHGAYFVSVAPSGNSRIAIHSGEPPAEVRFHCSML